MLTTFLEAIAIKPQISENNELLWDPISQEVEDYYLPRVLGRGFAYAVQKTPASYADLLDGVEFQDCNDETVYFKGLKYILTFFTFAQYAGESKIQDTFTGFVQKDRNDATTSTQGQESTIKQTNRKYAEAETDVLREYLNQANEADSEAYPLWNCTTEKKRKLYTPKFTPIKRTRS